MRPRDLTFFAGTIRIGDAQEPHAGIFTTVQDGLRVPRGHVTFGAIAITPSSPAQCMVIAEAFKQLGHDWLAELDHARRMGSEYVYLPPERQARPWDVKDELDEVTPEDVAFG